jgi:protein phosphatase
MVATNGILKLAERVSYYTREDIEDLLQRTKSLFEKEDRLIILSNKSLIFIGDTHGDWEATRTILTKYWDTGSVFVFLGDYVDRGPFQIENINLLYELKIRALDRLVLLRGNHEIPSINRYYGFYDEVHSRLGDMHHSYWDTFAHLPLAAISRFQGIFAVHGGVPEGLTKVEEINQLPRESEPENLVVSQLLWNDPKETLNGFARSMRGGRARYFGRDVTERFLKKNKLDLIVRAHEVFPHGYYTFFDGLVMSLFSCRDYRGPIAGKALLVKQTGERELIPI